MPGSLKGACLIVSALSASDTGVAMLRSVAKFSREDGRLEIVERRGSCFRLFSPRSSTGFWPSVPYPLDRVAEGDVAQVVDSGGLFLVEDMAVENERAKAFEISATGPIFGTKMKAPEGEPAQDGKPKFWSPWGYRLAEDLVSPRGIRLAGARRALRVRPQDMTLIREEESLRLEFGLPPGSYATVLLEELFGDLQEGRG